MMLRTYVRIQRSRGLPPPHARPRVSAWRGRCALGAGPLHAAPGKSELWCLRAHSSSPSSLRTCRVPPSPPMVVIVPAFASRCGKRPTTAHVDLPAGSVKADPSPRRPGCEVLRAGDLCGPGCVPSVRRGASCGARPSPAPSPWGRGLPPAAFPSCGHEGTSPGGARSAVRKGVCCRLPNFTGSEI